MKLLVVTLVFLLFLSCVRTTECHIHYTNLENVIEETEDCHRLAYCGGGGYDEGLLKLCLCTKKQKEQMLNENSLLAN